MTDPGPRLRAPLVQQIRGEMVDAAKMDGVTFDDEQLGFIEQAISDAAREALLRASASAPLPEICNQQSLTTDEAWKIMDRIYKKVVAMSLGQPWPTTAFYDFGVPILVEMLNQPVGASASAPPHGLLVAAKAVLQSAQPKGPTYCGYKTFLVPDLYIAELSGQVDKMVASASAVSPEPVTVPMVAGLLLTLKAECEAQHARYDALRAAVLVNVDPEKRAAWHDGAVVSLAEAHAHDSDDVSRQER